MAIVLSLASSGYDAEAWIGEYASIYEDYLGQIRSAGVSLGTVGKNDVEIVELRHRLQEKGALFRNGGASISVNGISTACSACTGHQGSQTFFISLQCPRNCYFCFNVNQESYRHFLANRRDWRKEFDALQAEGVAMAHIGLTGGEPLIHPDEAVAFFEDARRRWPGVHLRLYTSGYGLDDALLDRLVRAGMSEIRFSVKPDEGWASCEEVMGLVRMAAAVDDLDAMVEMPVIPGTIEEMKRLLVDLDDAGAVGINLLEFCFPMSAWDEFESRGFRIKNPPFPVLYDYSYAGALPIEDSDTACLKLLEFAIDEKLSLGVHYCSLENKHRDQVLTQNRMAEFTHACYVLDPDDFFFKTIKVYGEEALAMRKQLVLQGVSGWEFDGADGSLSVSPTLVGLLADAGVDAVVSYSILEMREGAPVLRELTVKREAL